jgi:hypothetical protein
MVLHVALGVPESFVAKAQYAIRVLLAPYDVSIVWSDINEVASKGGFYYGVLPFPDVSFDEPVVVIESLARTWEYFDSKKRYDPTDATSTEFRRSGPIPILFGSHFIDNSDPIVTMVYADIVASAFFWLSDWQDVTRTERDSHGRQPFQGSLQQLLRLQKRALVDEYSDLLATLMDALVELQPRSTNWQVVFSHDIDRIRKKTAGIAVRESLDYLILNRRNVAVKQRFSRWRAAMSQLFRGEDAYEASIREILNGHSRRGIQGCFLLKSVLNRHLHDANDYFGYPFFNTLLSMLRNNKTEIGYHSGYMAGEDPDALRAEHGRLCNRVGQTVDIHRSHYLRYKAGVTFPVLEQLGVTVDSSVAWAEQTGFRAQTCRPYPLFDVSSNRTLNVLEIPLSVMDTQMFGYMKLNVDDAIADATAVVHTVKRHNGVMVWNFHHHIFDEMDAPGWHHLLEAAYTMAKEGTVATFRSIHDDNTTAYA